MTFACVPSPVGTATAAARCSYFLYQSGAGGQRQQLAGLIRYGKKCRTRTSSRAPSPTGALISPLARRFGRLAVGLLRELVPPTEREEENLAKWRVAAWYCVPPRGDSFFCTSQHLCRCAVAAAAAGRGGVRLACPLASLRGPS